MFGWDGWYSVDVSYYLVDPATWADARKLDGIVSGKVTRDLDMATLGQATFEMEGDEGGEFWLRAYVDVSDGEQRERVPMGAWLVQTPRRTDEGAYSMLQCTAYTPLQALADAKPNAGYSLAAGSPCLAAAAAICAEHGVAPVVEPAASDAVLEDHYVAPKNVSWLDVAATLAAAAGMKIRLDGYGRVTFAPDVPAYAKAPAWTFGDGEDSIIMPGATDERDWYKLPNVCAVVTPSGIVGRAENADPSSKLSTAARGREVTLTAYDPDELRAGCTQAAADRLALRMLREASAMERKIGVTHGYCPVTIGDLVRIQAPSMGIVADATVARQDIELGSAFTVNATLTCREELWDGE